MRKANFFERIRAAQNLSNAFANGQEPRNADLDALGLPGKFKSRFKR